ncbi:AAA family ATPase [Synechococcus sp. CS-1326]|nr:AAA family ATPase [Synechococcus sp. CS-1326]
MSFFLLGPRGTGKSTWLRQVHCTAYWLDLLDPEAQRLHQARPERLRERLAGEPGITTVVIDEVQKVPGQLESAGRTPGGAWLHPFLAAELGVEFSLERALRVGLVPLVWEAADAEQTLRSCTST